MKNKIGNVYSLAGFEAIVYRDRVSLGHEGDAINFHVDTLNNLQKLLTEIQEDLAKEEI